MSNYKWENLNSENEFTKNTPLANEICGGWGHGDKLGSNILLPKLGLPYEWRTSRKTQRIKCRL